MAEDRIARIAREMIGRMGVDPKSLSDEAQAAALVIAAELVDRNAGASIGVSVTSGPVGARVTTQLVDQGLSTSDIYRVAAARQALRSH